jgi:hypothetical protein
MENDQTALENTFQMGAVQEDRPIESPIVNSSYIDKLTMELLLNKTHYQKYLEKTDPQKHADYLEFTSQCNRLRRPILDMTSRLLKGTKHREYSQEVVQAFEKYAQIAIRYIEIQEIARTNEDEDTLFPISMNTGLHADTNEDEDETEDTLYNGSHLMSKTNLFFHRDKK